MYKIVIFFIVSLSIVVQSQSQTTPCCPYIDSIRILPHNPTINDTVRIVTITTTPNQGHQIYYYHHQVERTFNIIGCFYNGFLTAIQTYHDTTIVGQLSPGIYTVNYKGFISPEPENCLKTDSQSVSTTFIVDQPVEVERQNSMNDSFAVYPNPTKGNIYVEGDFSDDPSLQWELFDIQGKIVASGSIKNKLSSKSKIDISTTKPGAYILILKNNNITERFNIIRI